MEKIALSPDDVIKFAAEYKGDKFTFEVQIFTVKEQLAYEEMIQEHINKESPLVEVHKGQWLSGIKNCTLENAFDVLPYVDIKKILNLINDVNTGVIEKKS